MTYPVRFCIQGLVAAALAFGPISAVAENSDLLPPGAKAGECFARVMTPAAYETTTEQILKKDASKRIEIVPAQYEWAEEQVLVRAPSKKLEIVPAEYETVTEEIVVRQASSKIEEIPAEYSWVEEQVLVRPAQTVWKKGRGPIEKVDNGTGEIMCLVEEPAVYETVKKRILKTPARTATVEIPAKTKLVKKRIMKTPPTTREIEIPAEYDTVRVQKLVSPPKEQVIEIPAEYTTVTSDKLTTPPSLEWRQILCETNIRPGTIAALQRSLKAAGFNPGPIDGQVGGGTLTAVNAYQKSKGLPTGGLTLQTLQSLGIEVQ